MGVPAVISYRKNFRCDGNYGKEGTKPTSNGNQVTATRCDTHGDASPAAAREDKQKVEIGSSVFRLQRKVHDAWVRNDHVTVPRVHRYTRGNDDGTEPDIPALVSCSSSSSDDDSSDDDNTDANNTVPWRGGGARRSVAGEKETASPTVAVEPGISGMVPYDSGYSSSSGDESDPDMPGLVSTSSSSDEDDTSTDDSDDSDSDSYDEDDSHHTVHVRPVRWRPVPTSDDTNQPVPARPRACCRKPHDSSDVGPQGPSMPPVSPFISAHDNGGNDHVIASPESIPAGTTSSPVCQSSNETRTDESEEDKFAVDCGIPDGFQSDGCQNLDGVDRLYTAEGVGSTLTKYDVMAGSVGPSWLRDNLTHAEIAAEAATGLGKLPQQSRRDVRAVTIAEYVSEADQMQPWPRRTSDPPSPPPPVVTKQLVREVARQDSQCSPDRPFPPALSGFVSDLEKWRVKLTKHFGFNETCFASNTRNAASRIADRISFLPEPKFKRVMDIVKNGYKIPFTQTPPRFHRQANSPDLSTHMDAAWAALKRDMGHGAVVPRNLKTHGKPRVTSPVRTAPKGWRSTKRRFVVNMRFLNRFIPDAESACSLDTLSKIRNLLTFPGANSTVTWSITMDLASGYHNFWIAREQWDYMGLALHISELPVEAVQYLRKHFPECEDVRTGLFYFVMRALPFGLAPSCAIFSLVVTSLAAAWRRHSVCGIPLRLTSYIDDFLSISRTIRQALITAIELVYEATAAGLTISVDKCRLGPATIVKYLGMLIDSRSRVFRLPRSRVERIQAQLHEINEALTVTQYVPARSVAQLVGLLWAIAPCCRRAVSVMARGLIALLTSAMSASVWARAKRRRTRFTLKRLLSVFWDGDVRWTGRAGEDLQFWSSVDLHALRAPISADTLEVIASTIRVDTARLDHRNVAFMASDASDTACGGGLLAYKEGSFDFDETGTFFSLLTPDLDGASSGLREIVAIF